MSKLFINKYGELCCIADIGGEYHPAIIDGFCEIDGKQCFHSTINSAKTELFLDTEL